MDQFKVFAIWFLFTFVTLQLCHTGEVHSNYVKFNYLNKIRFDGSDSDVYKKRSTYAHNHVRRPRSIESYNSEIKDKREVNPSSTKSNKNGIFIIDQKYSQNTTGEYKHEVLFSNEAWRAEQGEYEDHDGVKVFVIRGVFSYYTKEGTYNTTLYIVDEFGYHNVPAPPAIQDGTGLVDYRPDLDSSVGCNNEKGTYCIDPKLLALLVG